MINLTKFTIICYNFFPFTTKDERTFLMLNIHEFKPYGNAV